MALKIRLDMIEAWYNKGTALNMAHRPEEAINCFDYVIAHNPVNSSAWYNKGLALAELGRGAEADECFALARKLGEP
jgi:tetratricopeptide (TPR) repeat protein